MPSSRLVNRNVQAPHGRTSVRLEPELWDALRDICLLEDAPLEDVVRRAATSLPGTPLTSGIRVFVMTYFREAATEAGHAAAGHGSEDGLLYQATETLPTPHAFRRPGAGRIAPANQAEIAGQQAQV